MYSTILLTDVCMYDVLCTTAIMVLLCLCVQAAREDIAMIKVVAPQMVQRVVDRAMQVCTIGSFCILYSW